MKEQKCKNIRIFTSNLQLLCSWNKTWRAGFYEAHLTFFVLRSMCDSNLQSKEKKTKFIRILFSPAHTHIIKSAQANWLFRNRIHYIIALT